MDATPPTPATAVVPARPSIAAQVAEAAAIAKRGTDIAARRSGAVPPEVRRLSVATCRKRASQLRRFGLWIEGPGSAAASLADAVDGYAEARFSAGASVATVAGDVDAAKLTRSGGLSLTRSPAARPMTGR